MKKPFQHFWIIASSSAIIVVITLSLYYIFKDNWTYIDPRLAAKEIVSPELSKCLTNIDNSKAAISGSNFPAVRMALVLDRNCVLRYVKEEPSVIVDVEVDVKSLDGPDWWDLREKRSIARGRLRGQQGSFYFALMPFGGSSQELMLYIGGVIDRKVMEKQGSPRVSDTID